MKSAGKLKGFDVATSKVGRVTLKKLEDEQKKKIEEEQTQEVLQEFVAAFEGDSKNRTWIKGGIVNSSKDAASTDASSGRLYKPVSKVDSKVKVEESKPDSKKTQEKPPILGKRRGQEQKKSKLEQFKEELKLIQQQREQRHALRQGKVAVIPPIVQSELDLSDVGGRGHDYHDSPASSQGMGAIGNNSGSYNRRAPRDRRDDYPYDFDGDRTTTNLFLGNLNPKMTEQQLCEAFGRYGPLASVKIMWPRTDEERSRGRNCGFVAFMNRRDGERALENIRGKELMGFEMKLGWGKSVPIPLYPVYIPPALLELIKPPPPSGLPFNAQPREWLKSLRLAIKERAKMVTDGADVDTTLPPGPTRKPFDVNKMTKEELNEVLRDAVVKVVIPSDRSILALIHRLIEFVVLEGPQFEAAIMHREQNNPQFKFLFDYQSSEHVYYRWKLWSILHGESVNNWKTDEFRMFECGPLWRPPPMNLFSGGMPEDLIEEDDYPYAPGYVPPPQSRRNQDSMHDEMYSEALAVSRRCGLTEAQRGRFIQMLVDLEPSRTNIGDVMVWCLEHADAAADITDCVIESISSDTFGSSATSEMKDDPDESKSSGTSSITKMVARLFLISDILYNSSAKVPNASFFRKCFESRLPDVFRSINSQYKKVEGKLKAEQLKQKVMLCFRAWEDWAVYPNEYLIKLQNIFLGLVSDVVDEADLAGIPLECDGSDTAGVEFSGKKLIVLDSDVEVLQGQPLVQYDGDPLDVDGSPLESNDTQDVAPRPKSDTMSNSRMATSVASEPPPRLFVPSKWETVDPETVESEAVTTASRWELLVESTPQQPQSMDMYHKEARIQPSECESWKRVTEDDDLDGQPLTTFGSLVAYDDEDIASPTSSEPDNNPAQNTIPLPSTSTAKHPGKVESPTLSTVISEERRNQLREIELKVLKYQDELKNRRKGDKSVTEEAINKQIQRYRERLLEKLNEDNIVTKKQNDCSYSKSKGFKDKSKANAKRIRREHSVSPPASNRDFRDRSPPRSFRDRPRRRPLSPNTPDDESYSSPLSARLANTAGSIESPYRSTVSRTRTAWEPEEEEDRRPCTNPVRRHRVPPEELEEGEASDEEDSVCSQRVSSKRSHYCGDDRSPLSPRGVRKRQRSRSPDSPSTRSSHSYRSRTPSPNRRRGGVSTAAASNNHRKK